LPGCSFCGTNITGHCLSGAGRLCPFSSKEPFRHLLSLGRPLFSNRQGGFSRSQIGQFFPREGGFFLPFPKCWLFGSPSIPPKKKRLRPLIADQRQPPSPFPHNRNFRSCRSSPSPTVNTLHGEKDDPLPESPSSEERNDQPLPQLPSF